MAKKKTNTKPTVKEKLDIIQEATQPDTFKPAELKGCERLNVRMAPRPNAPVAEVIEKGADVAVDTAVDEKDFFKVVTGSGISGYCMKKYLKVSK